MAAALHFILSYLQSDLAYPVLFYPDPSLSTDPQHTQCILHDWCSVIRFPRLSGHFCGKRMCAVKRGLTVLLLYNTSISYSYISVPTFMSLFPQGPLLSPWLAITHIISSLAGAM